MKKKTSFYKVPLYNIKNYKGELEFVDNIVVTKSLFGVEEVITNCFIEKCSVMSKRNIDIYQQSCFGSQFVVFSKDINKENEVGQQEIKTWVESYSNSYFKKLYEEKEERLQKLLVRRR